MSAPIGEILSPKGLVVRAGVLTAIFIVCHLLGLREFTTVLCGTYPSAGIMSECLVFLGLIYVLLYLAFTVVVPIFLIAAGLLAIWERHSRKGE